MLGMLVMTIDMSIATIALPKIQSGLAASPEQITWVLTSYMVAAAVGTPLAGAMAERLGFRPVFLIGVVGFGVASVACGLSSSLPQLVFFRAVQGLTGAVFQPLGQALLYDMNPPHRHGKVMSWYSMASMMGPMLGPVVGGVITDAASWRWLFLINGPLIAIVLVGVLAFMPKVSRERARPFDFMGLGFVAVAIAAAQLALDRGELLDWLESWEILLELGLAVVCAYMYLVHSMTSRHPFVDPAILRDRNLVAGLIVVFFLGILVFVPVVLMTLFLQVIQGYEVLDAAIIQTPRIAVMTAVSVALGRMAHRLPLRAVVFCGALVTMFGFYELTRLSTDSTLWFVIWTGSALAVGTMMMMLPLNLITFATLPSEMRPMGMSLFHLTRQLGHSVGIAMVIAYVTRNTNDNFVRLVAELNPFNDALALGASGVLSIQDPTSLKLLTLEVYRQTTTIAYANSFAILMAITIATVPLVFILRTRRPTAPAPPDPQPVATATA